VNPRKVDAAVYLIAVTTFITPHSREHPKHLGDITDAVVRKEHCEARPTRLRGNTIYLPEP